MIYTIGDKYSGNWVNNQKNGEGTMEYSDGTITKGLWVKDELTQEYTV